MKKLTSVIIPLMLLILLISGISHSAENENAVQAVFAKFMFKLDDKDPVDIKPLVHEGTTYLPVREIADLFEYDVAYDEETRTIKLHPKNDPNKKREELSQRVDFLKHRLKLEQESLEEYRLAVERIENDATKSQADKEWGLATRRPLLENAEKSVAFTKNEIIQIEAELAELLRLEKQLAP